MNENTSSVSAAYRWFCEQIERIRYGRVYMGVQVHDGQVIKVYHTIEDSAVAIPAEKGARE